MAPLADIIALLRPNAVLSKAVRGGGKWAVRYPAFEQPSFALVLEGSCWLTIEETAPLPLASGDFILFPATPPFTLASDRETEPVAMLPSANGDPPNVSHGDPRATPAVQILGGWFAFDAVNRSLLLDLLPAIILIRADDAAIEGVAPVVDLIRRETIGRRPGGSLIMTRLVEILLVEVIRSTPPEREVAGLLGGLRDPRLAEVLGAIHTEPARAWTLTDMAQIAGMSRSSFAERFARVVGRPPLGYLLQWRIAVARDLLAKGTPVSGVAPRVGFQSASAFSTAFSRVTGRPPRDVQRNKADQRQISASSRDREVST